MRQNERTKLRRENLQLRVIIAMVLDRYAESVERAERYGDETPPLGTSRLDNADD